MRSITQAFSREWPRRTWNRILRYVDAWRVENMVSIRKWLVSDGHPTTIIDRKLDEFRAQYVLEGAKFGASDEGMVKWYYERARHS